MRITEAGLKLIRVTGSDGCLVKAVAAVNIAAAALPYDPNAAEDNYESPESFTIEPDVYPGTLALTPNGTRQLKVQTIDPDTGEQTDISQPHPTATSGTRYYSSDESIATVSDTGLITAHGEGQATISVVHLGSSLDENGNVVEQVIGQSDITLNVQTAQLTDNDAATPAPQSIIVSAQDGAVISADTGETVLIGAGALRADTAVSIRRIDINNLQFQTGMPAPFPDILHTVGAFRLELGEGQVNVPVQLAITLQDNSGLQAGDEVMFLRRGTVPDINGVEQDTWWILDNGYVGADGVARTASPPYSGINNSGEYLVVSKSSTNTSTGEVTLSGASINLYALTAGSVSFALGAGFASAGVGALGAVSVMGILAANSVPIFSLNRTLDGAFQVQEIKKVFDTSGKVTLKIEAPTVEGSGTISGRNSPHIFDVEADGRKLVVKLDNVLERDAQGQIKQNLFPTKLRFWISPDQLDIDNKGHATSDLWKSNQTEHKGILAWEQLADIEVGGDTATATLVLPEHAALGLHILTVQRMVEIPVDPANGIKAWIIRGERASVAIEGQADLSIVTTAREINVIKNDIVKKELKYADAKAADGQALPSFVGGYKTDQLVFSEDSRLLFVAGSNGRIVIVDTATLRIVDYWKVPGSTENISSLAVSGKYLYVAEGPPVPI